MATAGAADGAAPGGPDEVAIRRNDETARYELTLGGRLVSVADFYDRDGVIVLPHTETVPAFGGRGLAARLIGYALEDIAARGLRVDPVCPFVDVHIRRHPEYEPLRAG